MGLFDSILGSSSKQSKPQDLTPQQYKDLRGQLASILGGATSGTSTLDVSGVPSYSGQYTAPATDQETAIMNMLFGQAGGAVDKASLDPTLSGFTAGGTPLQQAGTADILKTLRGDYLSPSSNPFLAESIKVATDPITQAWQENVLPNLKIGFSKAGQSITGFGSSPFDRAAALASNDYLGQIEKATSDISSTNYTNERNRMLQALGLGQTETGQEIGAQTSNLASQQAQQQQNAAERAQKTQELVTTLNAVALPRLIEQYGLDQGTTEFRNRLASLMQLLGVEGNLSISTPSQLPAATPASSGQAGDLLGGLGGLAQGGAALYAASDRRLKTGVKPLGVSFAGVPLYEFAYRWEPTVRRWGVMAQEAPAVAVRRMSSGFLAVNYAMLGAR